MPRGLLAKIRVHGGRCEGCRAIYIPDIQASKVGVEPGWYPSLIEARAALESNPAVEPAIRINRNRYCPDCPNAPLA